MLVHLVSACLKQCYCCYSHVFSTTVNLACGPGAGQHFPKLRTLSSSQLPEYWNTGQDTEEGSCSFLQGIFPTQGLNPGFPHCRWILYQLSQQRSPRILEWVAYPFSSRSFRPRNQTRVSCIASWFFTNWAIRKAQLAKVICNFLDNMF